MNDLTTCTTQSGDNLGDMFKMSLTYESIATGGTAQYNGNISTMQWSTSTNTTTCSNRSLYRFSYNNINQLTSADYLIWTGSWNAINNYNESNITYDLNGNIKTYTRRGLTSGTSTFGVIDQLTYTYGDVLRPDRLTQMADVGSNTKGFKSGGAITGDHYLYDANGNMTQDKHKGFVIAYNYMNLPVTFTKGTDVITMTYTAEGEKLTKAVTGGGATKNYMGGIEYTGVNLEAIYHKEGRLTPNGSNFYYEYTLKDHLGSARVRFRANGTTVTFLEEMHYYPFGMRMEGIGSTSTTNKYTYNYKEINDDFGLNLHDYGARWFDPIVGRWWNVDPMAEKYGSYSTYNYGINNPARFIDPDGSDPGDVVVGFTGGIYASNPNEHGNIGLAADAIRAGHTNVEGGQVRTYPSNLWEFDNHTPEEPSPAGDYPGLIPDVNFPPTKAVLDEITEDAFQFIKANYNKDRGKDVEGGKIIIFGFSYGGLAAMHLARRLEKEGLPVAELITLDAAASVLSDFQDRTVPENTESNHNVYQRSTDNTVRSRGDKNKREDGSERGIVNIKVTENHEKVDDGYAAWLIIWVLETLNKQ